jgi:hypothetical protein
MGIDVQGQRPRNAQARVTSASAAMADQPLPHYTRSSTIVFSPTCGSQYDYFHLSVSLIGKCTRNLIYLKPGPRLPVPVEQFSVGGTPHATLPEFLKSRAEKTVVREERNEKK